MLTYKQKLEQANREAVATVIGLAVTIVVWIVCGFGLAGLDAQVLHTPIWIVGGTLGTWACAIVVSVVLAKKVFADFDLGDEVAAAPDNGDVARCPEAREAGGPGQRATSPLSGAVAGAKEGDHE